MRLKLGMLLGTVAALAVAIPTILHALAFIGDQERKVGEDNLELARVVGVLTEWRIEQTFATARSGRHGARTPHDCWRSMRGA